MATVIRPPLVSNQQRKRPLAPLDVQQRSLALLAAAAATLPPGEQWFESAPRRKPWLPIGQPLLGLIVDNGPEPAVRQLSESAPTREPTLAVEQYTNLLRTTLAATTPLAFPLNSVRWDAPAPRVKYRPQVDVYPNPVVLQPVPAVEQLDTSAPQREFQVRFDDYQNLLGTTLAGTAPLAFPLNAARWDAGAPQAKEPVYFEIPQNTLAQQPVPPILQLDQSAPRVKPPVQVDVYPNLRQVQAPQAPIFSGVIPDIFQRKDTGTYTYDLSVYFVGALTYAISPAIETGWSFDTNTAVLVIDTDEIGVFGPFTVTATNGIGDTLSNAFSVEVAASSTGAGRRTRRQRLFVEIDGRDFEVASVAEAVELLDRAKQVAVAQIEKAREAPAQVKPGIKRPSIRTNSPELVPLVVQARTEIVSMYDDMLRDLELRYLLAKAQEEDDEEAILRLLM